MSNPFDYVNNICSSHQNIWEEPMSDKEYAPYMVNKALSQHYDTIMFAQEMNQRSHIPNRWQYDFYRVAIQPKRKRFAKWHKPDVLDKVDAIAQHYQINRRTAEQYISLINNSVIDNIMETLSKGGRNAKPTTK